MTNHLDETAGMQPGKILLCPGEIFKWYNRRMTHRMHRKDKAAMIEDFIANDLSIMQIAKKYDVSYYKAGRAISCYFKKLPYSISIMSNV